MLETRKLIIFFIPPEEFITGGIMSIFSLCKETRILLGNKADVFLCTFPGSKSYRKNTLFKNDETVYEFDDVMNKTSNIQSLLFHIPEYATNYVISTLLPYRSLLEKIDDFQINILNQNMELMPKPTDIASIWSLPSCFITQTTAHLRYTTQAVADTYNTPVLNLSVFIDPHQYELKNFSQKENIIAYSNDKHPSKKRILSKVEKELPSFSLIEINNLSYEQYKELIAKAKYILTFGEGFDGYYIEGIFSGCITFAVYNDTFFESKDFLQYNNIFNSYDDMETRLVETIKKLDEKDKYTSTNQKNFKKLSKIYDISIYHKNIKKFYDSFFSFYPSPNAATIFFNNAIYARDQSLRKHEELIYEKDQIIQSHSKELETAYLQISHLNNDLVQSLKTIEEQGIFIEKIRTSIAFRIAKKIKSAGYQLKKRLLM